MMTTQRRWQYEKTTSKSSRDRNGGNSMYTECVVRSDNICGCAFRLREDGRNYECTGNAHDTGKCC